MRESKMCYISSGTRPLLHKSMKIKFLHISTDLINILRAGPLISLNGNIYFIYLLLFIGYPQDDPSAFRL